MKADLIKAISLTHAYYHRGQHLEDEVLLMYAEDLADLDVAACVDAYNRWRRNPKNRTFPLPAHIRELVNPEEFVSNESQAREIAGRVCGAVPKFGYANANAARLYIGPEGWSAVQRQGGWQYLCEQLGSNINPAIFQAQLRDLIEGSLHYGVQAIEHSIGALPSRQQGLTPVREIGWGANIKLNPKTDPEPA